MSTTIYRAIYKGEFCSFDSIIPRGWGTISLMEPKIWVRTVESQNRLRFPVEVLNAIQWAGKKQDTECIAYVGRAGQIQIAQEMPSGQLIARVNESLKISETPAEDADAPWVDFVRFFATAWKVTFRKEESRGRVTLILPREAREMGVAPLENTPAVLFVMGAIVEVWKASEWLAHIRSTRARLSSVEDSVLDELQSRPPLK